MDDGLIQILVIAFFIIISMMDGAARKKRKEAQRRGRVATSEGGTDRDEWRSTEDDATSEGMVPDELWEEIAALAKGAPPESTRRLPPTRVPGADRTPYGAEEPEEISLRPEHQHVERHDHVEWAPEEVPAYPVAAEADPYGLAPTEGTDVAGPAPSRSAPSRRDRPASRDVTRPEKVAAADPYSMRASGSGGAVRMALRRGGRDGIRQAVILAEVLGSPAALRKADHEPPG